MVTGALAVALVSVLSGCGQDEPSIRPTAPRTKTVVEHHGHHWGFQAGDRLPVSTFSAKARAALSGATSFRFAVRLLVDVDHLTGRGVVVSGDSGQAMQMSLRTTHAMSRPRRAEIRVVDAVTYVAEGGRGFQAVGSDPSADTATSLADSLGTGMLPTGSSRRVSVTYVGDERHRGADWSRFRLRMPTTPDQRALLGAAAPRTLAVELWLGSDDLPRKLKVRVPSTAGLLVVTYSGWNKPAHVEAPAV